MASLLHRVPARTGLLLVVLCVLVAAVVVQHAGWLANDGTGGATPPPFTAAEKAAAQAFLVRLTPPSGFRRIVRWQVFDSKEGVPCLPKPAVCFSSDSVYEPLTASSAGGLLASFGVHASTITCPDEGVPRFPIQSCQATGAVGRYRLGAIVTAVRAHRSGQHSGTEVTIFAVGVRAPQGN
jgi:hypothetical protein